MLTTNLTLIQRERISLKKGKICGEELPETRFNTLCSSSWSNWSLAGFCWQCCYFQLRPSVRTRRVTTGLGLFSSTVKSKLTNENKNIINWMPLSYLTESKEGLFVQDLISSESPILYVKMGYIDWLEIFLEQKVLSRSTR